MSVPRRRRVTVIGAGAAGSMAAIFAARGGADVELLERTKDGGRKILISGGGRCNVLPASLDVSRFVSDSSPNVVRRIVRSWSLADQIAFFERDVDVRLVEETESGKLFPVSNKARDVRDGLLAVAQRSGVRVRMNVHVTAVRPGADGSWRVDVAGSESIESDAVIVASGGLSVPATGSDGFGLRAAELLGHTVHATYAALTPLTAEPHRYVALAGVSLVVTVSARDRDREAHATGGFLFTHRGYSGPAILDVSHVAVRSESSTPAIVSVQWTALGDREWTAALTASGTRSVLGALREELPERLAAALIEHARVDPVTSLAELRRDDRRRLVETLVRCVLPWSGDEGYRKAEVTGGGVSLAEIDARTMESRRHPGLFLCGELLDAFGPIGGYNFLWAWITGRAAGIGAAHLIGET